MLLTGGFAIKQYKIPTGLLTEERAGFPDLERLYQEALLMQRENSSYAVGREWEKNIAQGVAAGNTGWIRFVVGRMEHFVTVGELSSSAVRSLRYYVVAIIALITRAAMDGGMTETEAYALSDALIYKLDTLEDSEQISRLSVLAILEFTRRMERLHHRRYSPPVAKCVTYISGHLNEPVTLADLSRVCGRSEGYISALFREELGISAKKYVLREKLAAARELLVHTDRTVQQIAETFFFASSSHFSAAFKRQYGVTPSQYRRG